MNLSSSPGETKTLVLYWLIPSMIVVLSALGILYALITPPIPITDATVLQYLPVVSDTMMQHARLKVASWFTWTILNIVFFAIFIQFGWAAQLRDFVQTRSSKLVVQVTLFTLIYSTAQVLIESPLSYLTGYFLPHHFGLSAQPIQEWLLDLGKGFAVGTVLESLGWFFFFLLLSKFPKRWPIILFLASVPLTLFMTYIEPVVFEPIFNKFEAMAPSKLQRDIKVLAEKSGFADAPIFISDQHKRTNTVNAYVTGIGHTARIVIWDTTISKMPPEQVLCIVAHEIGHYKYIHVLYGCLLAIAAGILTIPLNYFVTPRFFKHCPKAWQIQSVNDLAAIPVIILSTTCLGFWESPISNTICRQIEHDADMFAIHSEIDRVSCAKAFAFFAKEDLSEPNPPELIKIWLYSHPPLAERIESAINAK